MNVSLPGYHLISRFKEKTRKRSISRRFLFIGFFMMAISIIVSGFTTLFVISQYQTLYQQEKILFQDAVEHAISKVFEPREKFLFDYTHWSDMAEAVQLKDVTQIRSDFLGSLNTFETDKVWVFDQNAELLYEESHTPEKDIPLSINSQQLLPLLQNKSERIETFEVIKGNPVRIIAGPIVFHTADKETEPAQGVMIMAKIWDESVFQEFESLTQSEVSFLPASLGTRASTNISYEKNLKDQFGNTLGYLHFEKQINSLLLIERSIFFIIFIAIITGIPLILLNFLFQKNIVLDPLSDIILQLKNSISTLPSYVKETENEIEILSEVTAAYISQKHLMDYQNEKIVQSEHLLETAVKNQQSANQKLATELRTTRKLSKVAENSTNAVIITDMNGTIEYVNPSWEKLNGYSLKEVKGKNPDVLQSGKTPKEIYEKMWKRLNAGKTFSSDEIINKRKDGTEYFCQLSVFPIQEGTTTINFVGLQQDISKQKEVDRMKTEFISLASHQLRTPLSAMRWFSELLMANKAGKLSKEQNVLMQSLYQSTLRMIDLVNMLLNITRIESGRLSVEPEAVSLPKLIDEVLKDVLPEIEKKKQTIVKDFDKKLPSVKIDKKLFREVLMNLLTNANKYTQDEGTITISIRIDDEHLEVSVSDNGYGIPDDVQAKIFSKFFRADNITKTETDGTGLGLYLIKLIVETTGGKVWFKSKEKKGTTFFFTLPLGGMAAQKGEVHIS